MKKQMTVCELAVSMAATAFNKAASSSEALEILDIASAMVRIQAGRDAAQQAQQSGS